MAVLRSLLIASVLTALGFLPGQSPLSAQTQEADLKILQEAGVTTDGAGLAAFLRDRVPAGLTAQEIPQLVMDLTSGNFKVRENARKRLIALGPIALAHLRAAVKSGDAELAVRARECLREIEKQPGLDVHAAAVRRLALLKPVEAAAVLLRYLPFAAEEFLATEVRRALVLVAVVDGKPAPALLEGLKDTNHEQRAAAAEALCSAKVPDAVPAVRVLLRDPVIKVRLHAALALVRLKEREAVPVLIELLADVPADQRGPIEEVLYRLAGDLAPPDLTAPALTGRQLRDGWMAWWKQHAEKVSLDRLQGEPKAILGRTLLLQMVEGEVQELDPASRQLWRITGLSMPCSAQVLEGERVLIAEYRTGRVSERTLNGKVLWELKVPWPIAAQRLPNGNTFVATRDTLLEVDRAGRELIRATVAGHQLAAAEKMPNGQITCITSKGLLVRFDAQGKEVKRFAVGTGMDFGVGMHVSPGGQVVVPLQAQNKVVEFDSEGKVLREVKVSSPDSAFRLPSGNLLIASQRTGRVVEMDQQGKIVWEYRSKGQPIRATWR